MYVETVVVDRRFGELTDVRDFIRPNDPMVASVVNGRHWTVEGLWDWVLRHIEYPPGNLDRLDQHVLYAYQGRISGRSLRVYRADDFWNFPAETLRDRVGDCEDTAFLLVSMIRRALPGVSVRASVGYFYPRGYGPDMPRFGHVWAEVREGGRWRVLDTTLRRRPAKKVYEGPPGPYWTILRFNDREVEVVDPSLELPERTWQPGKDQAIASWYALVPAGTDLRRGV